MSKHSGGFKDKKTLPEVRYNQGVSNYHDIRMVDILRKPSIFPVQFSKIIPNDRPPKQSVPKKELQKRSV